MITATQKTARTLSGASAYTGTWGEAQIVHLLRRTLFGFNTADLDHFKSMNMNDMVDALLNTSSIAPSPPVNNYNSARLIDPDIALGDTWVNGPVNDGLAGARRSSLKSWWIGQMIHQDRTILEKMTLFWHNHFATEMTVYREPIHGYNHSAMLRADALGNFKRLVKDVTLDPAMLIYLNGNKNTKSAPDENYARELQELFTLGKGPDSGYTESDVQQAAKVLTGWRINRTTLKTYFDPNQHDTSDKTFSSFFNDTKITGKSGANGADEVDDLLDMIFMQDEVAKYVVRRLYRWFVYYDIDQATEDNVIDPLAKIFRDNAYDIKPVLKALFTSEHFFDTANFGCLIKSPIDYAVGLSRQFYLDFPDSSQVEDQYYYWNLIWQVAFIQQQDLGDPPSVAGWPSYYQLPQFHEIWINTDTLPKRNQITDVLIAVGVSRNGHKFAIEPIATAELFDKPEMPAELISDLLGYLHTVPVSQDQLDYMKSILLGGQVKDSYWTDAWNEYKADPTNTIKMNIVKIRLQQLLKYMMNLSEFQLS
jgi:uncharacterized protein (DUF1800 family)